MAQEFSRTSRIGEVIMRELAQMIQQELSDPRVGMVTVSHVDITSDLKYAKVYVTRLNGTESEQDVDECIAGLTNAAGFLKRGIAKRVEIRSIPELRFLYDKSLDHGFRMDELIAKANKDLTDD
ncbi:MAG: 30S ribosome-binding factor RbfA [Piscirickettsiaceae bacterium]|nr:30S ribosome-binding factor RbfA [Piscirickettsiaceae bacterium]